MHHLYLQKYEAGIQNSTVKHHYYSLVFNTEFNLSFGYPKTDTCGTCEKLKIELESLPDGTPEKQHVQENQEQHFYSAEKIQSDIRLDTEMAKNNQHIRTITFDFNKICLFLSSLYIGDLFYMCQLWVYVFGIHNFWCSFWKMHTIGLDPFFHHIAHYYYSWSLPQDLPHIRHASTTEKLCKKLKWKEIKKSTETTTNHAFFMICQHNTQSCGCHCSCWGAGKFYIADLDGCQSCTKLD